MGTSYLLSNAVVQPVISALSDIFGRRSLLFTSAIFFTVGSVIACLAHGVAQILAGRVVQGVGGGGIIVLTNVIISDIVPLRQRPKYLSITQLSWAVGTVAGPLVGEFPIRQKFGMSASDRIRSSQEAPWLKAQLGVGSSI